MAESLRQWYERLEVTSVLQQHPGLRIVPSNDEDLVISGTLHFRVTGPANETIEDRYQIEISIPPRFPESLPRVKETGKRIPDDYHKLEGNYLCLGAPTAIRAELMSAPTLPALVNKFVIPYLYGYSFHTKHGRTPYGELAHGSTGIRQNLCEMFGVKMCPCPEEFLRLAGMKKRIANKQLCACGRARRLGRCHNRAVNRLRRRLGRHWFQAEYERVVRMLMNLVDGETRELPFWKNGLGRRRRSATRESDRLPPRAMSREGELSGLIDG